jgi:hypothetical protein
MPKYFVTKCSSYFRVIPLLQIGYQLLGITRFGTFVDYSSMTDRELKRYMLDHHHDDEAFYAYMERRTARPNRTTISHDDPDWEAKITVNTEKQIQEGFAPMEVGERNKK